ncbi:MAG: NADH-quinone oxidoreductase subunit J [Candidatus Omnitrophica bacterium]|nr:NADH-quinone oxidoreductase subunit J [Candidatus Omnitrophota bacterium]
MIETILFIILGIILIFTSIMVITRINPISSALYLVFAFLSLASLYAMLSATFVAAIQILVYTGGILVLIIFVIMIMNLTNKELLPLRANYLLLFSVSLIILGGSLLPILLMISHSIHLGGVSLPEEFGTIKTIAPLLFEKFVFPFEMLSLLLLTAIVGALIISKRKL